ncbi:MAG: thiamine pyrophosphate-binding protein [Rikenellaceae bacterium]
MNKNLHYTDEKNVQIVISLLKQYGIRKIIASPGATNLTFLASVQQDSFFEIYSSVDERSAAYIACGLAAESGEAVVINCTGATSSRNYMSALTEAYYRKLPIIAITSSQISSVVGHLVAQVTDRSAPPSDVVRYSTNIGIVKDDTDRWASEIEVNNALLECRRHGGGPVHINLETGYSSKYDIVELPKYRKIDRITPYDKFPELPEGRVAIFVGSHAKMSEEEVASIENFCATNNSLLFCDHTSSYRGKFALNFSLVDAQRNIKKDKFAPDLVIQIGEISGEYYGIDRFKIGKTWRVSEDGELRDRFRNLTHVFEMPIATFFKYYTKSTSQESSYYNLCKEKLTELRVSIPELPFSNLWIASQISHLIPDNSILHLAILNSLRAWNMFDLPQSVSSMANVGGFGIDGSLSSLVGASLNDSDKLCYIVMGDLSFFYDMNVVGNRHIKNNVRILLVNNGKGTEFKNYDHNAIIFGDSADLYIAAAEHYGNKSSKLVKDYSLALGFEYLTASNKEEFNEIYPRFLTPTLTDSPMVFEVFTNSEEESEALKAIRNIEKLHISDFGIDEAKELIVKTIGYENVGMIKKNIKK